MPLTHYKILGLTPTATTEEIKRAYRRQALHWHPDRNPANPKAHRRFIAIKDAYAVLSAPERRVYYDAVLRQREQAKYNPPPFQQTYSPPPQYRPVYRERPSNRGWIGPSAGLLVWALFSVLRTCDTRDRMDTQLNLDGLNQRATRISLDSTIRAAGGWDSLLRSADTTRLSGQR